MNKKLRWTDNEIEFLKNKYSLRTCIYIAESLGRTAKSVELKAKRLGLENKYLCYLPVLKPTKTKKKSKPKSECFGIAQSNKINLMKREKYVPENYQCARVGADQHKQYQSRGF